MGLSCPTNVSGHSPGRFVAGLCELYSLRCVMCRVFDERPFLSLRTALHEQA